LDFGSSAIYINKHTLNRSRELKERLRYTQSIEVDEKKLCEMKDRLLQEEIAMNRLNPSSESSTSIWIASSTGRCFWSFLDVHGFHPQAFGPSPLQQQAFCPQEHRSFAHRKSIYEAIDIRRGEKQPDLVYLKLIVVAIDGDNDLGLFSPFTILWHDDKLPNIFVPILVFQPKWEDFIVME